MANIVSNSARVLLGVRGVKSLLHTACRNKTSRLPLAVMSSPAHCTRFYTTEPESEFDHRHMVNVTDTDKVILVKAKMFKNVDEVPARVSASQMRKARDFMRIRVSLWMIGATIGGCIVMIIYGRRLRDSGDSLTRRGMAWQEEMKRKGAEERENK